MKRLKNVLVQAFVLAVAVAAAAPARADIYGYVDPEGEIHLANHPTGEGFEVWAQVPREAAASPAAAAVGEPAVGVENLAAMRARYHPLVREAAKTYEVEPALLHAVISVESAYNPKAKSRKGASGLMQLMPETARRYGVADIFDPVQNIRAGARYLRDLLRMFNNDKSLALAAYNAGENAVARHGKIPPYQETVAYVPRVLAFYKKLGALKLDS
jgi:soluble lytic murein transglycosylase-like protein